MSVETIERSADCLFALLRTSESPDGAAARIGLTGLDPTVVVHSTSWRHLDDGTIVLTYAVVPDPAPDLAAARITSFRIARSDDPGKPSPPLVSSEQVAAHAARHLALVTRTDPQIASILSAWPDLAGALASLPHLPAGQLREA